MAKSTTPSEFYRSLRPEFFSDSFEIQELMLPKEVAEYILDQITTNQKENGFEVLCRKLAEINIAPNLIPQVGPTGGGDGKTDSETYPVSEEIRATWFKYESQKNTDKWAFAFSAKKERSSKVDSDVKKIVETDRGYTKIFFITNQTPSSKRKKDKQDKFIDLYGVDVIILDGKWIIEKVYENTSINIFVETLGLDQQYKIIQNIGKNDLARREELQKIEYKIANKDKYYISYFQLIEDILESARLSRMLENTKEETIGRFNEAIKIAKENNIYEYIVLGIYELSRTQANYFDDINEFIKSFLELKALVIKNPEIEGVDKWFNLLNVYGGLVNSGLLKEIKGNYEKEVDDFLNLNNKIAKEYNENTIIGSRILIYNTFITLSNIIKSNDIDRLNESLKILRDNINKMSHYLDYPFEQVYKMLNIFGEFISDIDEFDNIIDDIADILEERHGEKEKGLLFYKIGSHELNKNNNIKSIKYFGKAYLNLAKSETKEERISNLGLLGIAYRNLGLYYASKQCYVMVMGLLLKDIKTSSKSYSLICRVLEGLIDNDLSLGNIGCVLNWINIYNSISPIDKNIEYITRTDAILGIKLIDASFGEIIKMNKLPDYFDENGLVLSSEMLKNMLGYTDDILVENGGGFKDEESFKKLCTELYTQSKENKFFTISMFNESVRIFKSKILGTKIIINTQNMINNNLVSEIVLGHLESFLATTQKYVFPLNEQININISSNNETIKALTFKVENNGEYKIFINDRLFNDRKIIDIADSLRDIIIYIISNDFGITKLEKIEELFSKEEVSKRASISLYYDKYISDIYGGKNPYNDIYSDLEGLKDYSNINEKEKKFISELKLIIKEDNNYEPDLLRHDQKNIQTIINMKLWDKASRNGFGILFDPNKDLFGIMICFSNINSGKQIFEEWHKVIGLVDSNELIRISIIKGIDKTNPHHYRVHISKNISKEIASNEIICNMSKFHHMTPNDSTNLSNLEHLYKVKKRYQLIPCGIIGGKMTPIIDLGIDKTEIYIKNAREIDEKDIDMIAIRAEDDPVLPKGMEDAPVLKIIENKKTRGKVATIR